MYQLNACMQNCIGFHILWEFSIYHIMKGMHRVGPCIILHKPFIKVCKYITLLALGLPLYKRMNRYTHKPAALFFSSAAIKAIAVCFVFACVRIIIQ